MAEIIVSQQADDDFERIWLNIALDNDDAADRLLRAITSRSSAFASSRKSGARATISGLTRGGWSTAPI